MTSARARSGARPRQADHGESAARAHQAHVQLGVERDLIETSPAAKVKPPSPKVERERVLTDPEIYEVWHGADRLGWPFGPLVQLLMLTAQREGEIAAMRWSDLDLDKAIWSLPSKSTKAGRPHLVPLSTTAIRIIKAQPRLSAYVFPGRHTDGARPVCGFSKVKVRLDKICGVTAWVFHDLRRTAATKLAELGIPPHVTEKTSTTAAPTSPARWAGSTSGTSTSTNAARRWRAGRTRSCASLRRPSASAALPRLHFPRQSCGGASAVGPHRLTSSAIASKRCCARVELVALRGAECSAGPLRQERTQVSWGRAE